VKPLHTNTGGRGGVFIACALSLTLTLALAPVADLQGWNGPGWYVAGSAPLMPKPPATPAYILFNGPHGSQSDCALVHDRLYSPIGVCRLLDTKPGT
jgi:hypothetical protein